MSRYTWEADFIGDDVYYTESVVYDNEREEDGLPVIVARCYSQADAKRLCALLNAAPPTSPDTTADKE